MTTERVLRVAGLTVEATSVAGRITTVHDVDLQLQRGRICGVVGESGSGKSTTALAALGWSTAGQRRVAGRSELDGEDLFGLDPRRLRRVWGRRIGYVPQEIGGSLHPTYRVRTLFRETLRVNGGRSRRDADARAVELLTAAGIPDPAQALALYPHEFSGGQLQRIAIALALAPRPEVLILDEPTTGLDVTTQKVVVGILRELVDRERVAALFISHDIALLAGLADDLIVMYAGEVVESGPAALLLQSPKHPYTRALLDAMPSTATSVVPRGIPGLAPGSTVEGHCAFADRCRFVVDRCRDASPALTDIGEDRSVRCFRSSELVLRTAVNQARAGSTTHTGPGLLEVSGLTYAYGSGRGRDLTLADVSLTVPAGCVAGLVGESGSGKSTVARIVAGVLPVQAGTLRLEGEELPSIPGRRSQEQRRTIQLVFQDAGGSLNPRRRVGAHLARIADRFVEGDREQRCAVIDETLRAVQLSAELMDRFPAQLSGGQRQRVAIAAAFIVRPRLVICDEITSGQDVSVQAAILTTLSQLQRRFDTAVLFISHDLGVVRAVADHVYVMHRGRIVEEGPSERVFTHPSHPYTRALLDAAPIVPASSPAANRVS